jgi:hypothetical protein
MKTLIYSVVLLGMAITGANAQQVSTHTPWTKEDSAAINALALYPDSVRMEIFTACEYPAIIVNVASLQKNSSTAFADLVSSYDKTKQEAIWNLSRYPNLISRLVDGGKKSKEDIETILNDYPAEIHDDALKYGRDEYDLLKKVDDLQNRTNQQFSNAIASYPADVQKTFTDLLQLPEVMSLLNDHLSLTVRVGDHYKRDPQWVMHKSDSTATAEAAINAEQLQDWKQSLQQDSDAQSELQSAANEYATDNGYNQSDVDAPIDSSQVDNTAVYPYSYWFGYPTWYPYSYWYPYPYWYDWGFYYGPYGNMVIFGFPSFYFTNWYFCYPNHWHNYPHLGSAYIHHYYGARQYRSNTLSRQVVHNWVQANRAYLPAGFIKNNTDRVAALRQYGELNEKTMNKNGTVNAEARDQYLAKNVDKYPALNSHPAEAKIAAEKQAADVRVPFIKQPVVNPQRTQAQRAQQQQSQSQRVQTRSAPQPKYNYNTIQRAQSYQSGSWQQAQPTYHAAPAEPERSYGGGGGGGAEHSSGSVGGGRR